MKYKGHKIIRSEIMTANDMRKLFRIEGRFSKLEGQRPLITSVADAKRWINEQIVALEASAA